MKIFQLLTLLLLLVVLAMAWATWDMQRREAVAPGVDLSAAGKAAGVETPPLTVTPSKTKAVVVIPQAVCPTCKGKKEVHLEKEVVCRACGGDGFLQGSGSSHSVMVCNTCRGQGKIIKDTVQDCPTCQKTGQIAQAMAAQFKTCLKCQGAKALTIDTQAVCQNCRGTGKVISEMTKRAAGACPFCSGTGKLDRKEKRICPECFGSGVTYQPPPPPPST